MGGRPPKPPHARKLCSRVNHVVASLKPGMRFETVQHSPQTVGVVLVSPLQRRVV